MFDDLLVLTEGRVMYLGPAGKIAGHFRALGHSMPPDTNPAEFAIDVVSVDYTSKVGKKMMSSDSSLVVVAMSRSIVVFVFR